MAKHVERADGLLDEDLDWRRAPSPAQEKQNTGERHRNSIANLHLIWGERSFLMRVSLGGLLAATLIALLIPNRFTSQTLLMPPDQESGGGGTAMLAAMTGKANSALSSLGAELLGLKTSGDLFIGILHSRTVEDDVIARFDLRKVYGDQRWGDARRQLASRTLFSEDRKSGIITIAVTDRDPRRSQQMAQEYVTELNKVVIDLNTSSAHRERVFLEGRLGHVQQDLESAEKQFSQFASKNTAIDIQEQGKAMIEAGANLEGQLIAAETQLEGLRQIFTNSNVRVRETEARINELRAQLKKLRGETTAMSSAPGNASDMSYPSIRQLPLLGVSYADLYRRMKVEEAVFETLTQEYELAKVQEAKETPSVKVLDPADLPERKSFPPRLLIVVFGTLLAAAIGAASVLGRAKWDGTASTEPAKAFAVEVLRDVRKGLPWLSTNGSKPSVNEEHSSGQITPLDKKERAE